MHALAQLGISYAMSHAFGRATRQKILTLVAGLSIPAITLSVALFSLGLLEDDSIAGVGIPALYYSSMPTALHGLCLQSVCTQLRNDDRISSLIGSLRPVDIYCIDAGPYRIDHKMCHCTLQCVQRC